MAKFKIIRSDPEEYKEKILEFWEKYLPGTPPGRFEWMQNNPAGPAIWFLAFEEESNQLAGTISLMPREMMLNGQLLKAGIMGDFMTSNQYRVFGPAIELQRKVAGSIKELDFKLIYTLPNTASIKLAQRVGFENSAKLFYLVKPVRVTHYLNRSLAKLMAPIAELLLKLLSREAYTLASGYFEEVSTIDQSFDILWQKIINNETGLIGNHSSSYLNWRYLHNPSHHFRILTYRIDPEGECLGYLVFTVHEKKMEIFNVATLQQQHINKLLKKLIQIAKKEDCQAIYIRLLAASEFSSKFKQFGFFFDSKDNANILSIGEVDRLYERWKYFEGERNI